LIFLFWAGPPTLCLHPFLCLRSLPGITSCAFTAVMGIISHAFTAIFGIITRAFTATFGLRSLSAFPLVRSLPSAVMGIICHAFTATFGIIARAFIATFGIIYSAIELYTPRMHDGLNALA
jgi:hypothetical protein